MQLHSKYGYVIVCDPELYIKPTSTVGLKYKKMLLSLSTYFDKIQHSTNLLA